MKIKKTIIEKEEFGKMNISKNQYWVDWNHQGTDDHSKIIGLCTVQEDLENKCYTADIKLFEKDEVFTYPDGSFIAVNGKQQSKHVIEMLQKKCKLYPAISAKVLEKDENGVVTKCELLTVGICVSNADSTIPPLELIE